MSAVRTFIYGSCVSRDLVRLFPARYQITQYVARQSWVSANAAPIKSPNTDLLTSRFQIRSIRGDFASDAFEVVRENVATSDLVLLDIASDKHGVRRMDGSFVSSTFELRKSRAGRGRAVGKHIPFGSKMHYTLFKEAAKSLKRVLIKSGSFERTVLLRHPLSDQLDTGEIISDEFKIPASEMNTKFNPYYEFAERQLGFNVLRIPDDLAIISRNHHWGLNQNHYTDAAYHWWHRELQAFVAASSSLRS